MGSIYKRGEVYWIKYYRAGKPYRESSHSEKESEAKRLLKLREGHIAEGKFLGLKVERIRFEELAEDVVNDYKVNAKRSLRRIRQCLNHLLDYFEGIRAVEITTDRVRAYILQRQEEGAANGTINRGAYGIEAGLQPCHTIDAPKGDAYPLHPPPARGQRKDGIF